MIGAATASPPPSPYDDAGGRAACGVTVVGATSIASQLRSSMERADDAKSVRASHGGICILGAGDHRLKPCCSDSSPPMQRPIRLCARAAEGTIAVRPPTVLARLRVLAKAAH